MANLTRNLALAGVGIGLPIAISNLAFDGSKQSTVGIGIATAVTTFAFGGKLGTTTDTDRISAGSTALSVASLAGLSSFPWTSVKASVDSARRAAFKRPTPEVDGVIVEQNVETVRETLGEHNVNPVWILSKHYEGEAYNGRRYYHDPTSTYPHRQLHIRGYETNQGTLLIAHDEPAPEHHPVEHIEGDTLNWQEGQRRLMELLEKTTLTVRSKARLEA